MATSRYSKLALIHQLQAVRDNLVRTVDVETEEVLLAAASITRAIRVLKEAPAVTDRESAQSALEKARGKLEAP